MSDLDIMDGAYVDNNDPHFTTAVETHESDGGASPNLTNTLNHDSENAKMMDAEDSPTAPLWLDGANDTETPKSSKAKSKGKSKAKTSSTETTCKRVAADKAEEGDDEGEGEGGGGKATPAAKTPSKATPKKATPKQQTPKTSSAKSSSKRKSDVLDDDYTEEDEDAEEGCDTPSNKRRPLGKTKEELVPSLTGRMRRAPKNGIAESALIPRSYEECSDQDRMLVDMRKNDQYTWPQVREAWYQMTGKRTGNSTLPNRLERLRSNFSVIKEEDRRYLLKAKMDIDKEWEQKKWQEIAMKVRNLGGDSYGDEHLKRQWKTLMIKEGVHPPPGLIDPDWTDGIPRAKK